MHFHSNVSSGIGFVVALFIASTIKVFVNLLLGDVPLHLSDVDGPGALGFSDLFKVIPQVTI